MRPSTLAGLLSLALAHALPAGAEEQELDHLRALGYVDFAESPAPEGKAGVVNRAEGLSYPGYSLYASRPLKRAELIDETGRVVRRWRGAGVGHWSRVLLLESGDLLVVGSDEDREQGRRVDDMLRFVELRSWNDEVVWRQAVGAHHDVTVTPDGRIAALVSEERRIPSIDADGWVRDEGVAFFSREGEALGRVLFHDLLAARPDVFSFRPVRRRPIGGRILIDLLHANSVEWLDRPELAERHPLYRPGLVLICMRNQDAIAIVDLARGEAVWSWGQGEVRGPHDASLLANGNILLFDNRLGKGWSRAIELDPVARKIVWEWKAPRPADFYTRSRGSAQRLPNGNTLLGESDRGHAVEVTPAGEVVWEWWNPHRDPEGRPATIIRMERYERAFVERILLAQESANDSPQP